MSLRTAVPITLCLIAVLSLMFILSEALLVQGVIITAAAGRRVLGPPIAKA